MEKKYQVFISSTYSDLQNERALLIQSLLELDCIPTGMELFQAANDDQWTWIKRILDTCDYFIVIVAGRYGSLHPTTHLSYTEMEYRYARERKIPTIGFLYKHPENLPLSKSETDPDKVKKLRDFRELVSQNLVRYWETPHELSADVSRSMMNLIKYNPAIGWIRADQVAQFIQDAKIQDADDNISDEVMHQKLVQAINGKIKPMGYYVRTLNTYADDNFLFTLKPLDDRDDSLEYLFLDKDTYKNFFITLDAEKAQYIEKNIIDRRFESTEDEAFEDFITHFICKRFYELFDVVDRTAAICSFDNGKVSAIGGKCERLNKKIGKYTVFYENDKILDRADIDELFRLPHMKRGAYLFSKIDRAVEEWMSRQ